MSLTGRREVRLPSAVQNVWCGYLRCFAQLSAEREQHIQLHHPEMLPANRSRLLRAVRDPDLVRRSRRSSRAMELAKWVPDFRGGKFVVVILMHDFETRRWWIVTAYVVRRLAQGAIEWRRD